MRRFYYSIAGEDAQGPIWEDEFDRMRQTGALPETARVRIMGARTWIPLAQFLEEEAATSQIHADSSPGESESSVPGAPFRRALFKNLAIAILCFGACAAALIYWNAVNTVHDDALDALNWQNSRRDSYELEKNVGKFGVLMSQWIQSATDLTHSRHFALLLFGTSLAASGLFYAKASSIPVGPAQSQTSDRPS